MMGIELGDERKIVVREIIVDPIFLHFEPFGIEQVEVGCTCR